MQQITHTVDALNAVTNELVGSQQDGNLIEKREELKKKLLELIKQEECDTKQ